MLGLLTLIIQQALINLGMSWSSSKSKTFYKYSQKYSISDT